MLTHEIHEQVLRLSDLEKIRLIDQMPEAHFDIDIRKTTHIFSLDQDLAETLTTIARAKRISSNTLINKWLREKIVEQAKATP